MRFAFLVMGNFDCEIDKASIHDAEAQIIGVANIQEACETAKKLYKDGIGCIELCGAFGENGARAVIEATENKLPIGYVTHLPEQNDVYNDAFSN